MATFLFAAQPESGHTNPLLALARALCDAGHEAVFVGLSGGSVRDSIEAAGFRVVAIRPSLGSLPLALLPYASGSVESLLAIGGFFSGLVHYARAIGRALDEVGADVVVADVFLWGAGLAAETRGRPWAAVYMPGLAYEGPDIPPITSGLPIGATGRWVDLMRAGDRLVCRLTSARVGWARRRLGLAPAARPTLPNPASEFLTLVLTADAVEAPRHPLPPTAYFIGPCLGRRGGEIDFPFDRLDPSRPRIYLSLGTIFNRKPRVFRRILRALDHGRYQVVVSAGAAAAALAADDLGDHVLLFERVPQLEVLDAVDAVISHGGNNTINETLAAGRPLLVMPVGGEQRDNAMRVEWLGAGLRAGPDIGAQVDRILGEPSFAAAAARAAAALARTNGPSVGARLLERLAADGRPIVRPPGYPATILDGAPLPDP